MVLKERRLSLDIQSCCFTPQTIWSANQLKINTIRSVLHGNNRIRMNPSRKALAVYMLLKEESHSLITSEETDGLRETAASVKNVRKVLFMLNSSFSSCLQFKPSSDCKEQSVSNEQCVKCSWKYYYRNSHIWLMSFMMLWYIVNEVKYWGIATCLDVLELMSQETHFKGKIRHMTVISSGQNSAV